MHAHLVTVVAGLVACSSSMLEAVRLARLYAKARTPVVIVGPTGSGKTVLAEQMHRMSGRPGRFVPRSGGELGDSLGYDELFGHVDWAFTDARRKRTGALGEASGGTLLLDDLQFTSLALQTKLLRALDQRCYRPLGADRDLPVECRLIVGVRAHPDDLVAGGLLLDDLRARLGECVITLGSLAERREEIAPLADHFLRECPAEVGLPGPVRFAPEVLPVLEAAPWPRNIRQLKSVIQRAYLHARDADAIGLEHLPEPLCVKPEFVRHGDAVQNALAVHWALARAGGRHDLAAELLGIHRNTVAQYAAALGTPGAEPSPMHGALHKPPGPTVHMHGAEARAS
jgi:DNA-binding NtrC family response regulator